MDEERRVPDRPSERTDVDDEIAFHIEMRARDYQKRGLDPESARHAARRRFGDERGVRRALEREERMRHRVEHWREWSGELRRDIGFGLRMIRRSPLVFVVVILTLALGIGATTAVFSVVNGVLLRPLPFGAPDRLVRVWEVSPTGEDRNVVSAGNYLDWRARAGSFEAIGAHTGSYGVALTGDGDPVQISVMEVTPSVLRVLGVAPRRGRVFEENDLRAVVLSHAFWQTRFGGEDGVPGSTVTLDGVPHTVLGVMPPAFRFGPSNVQVWRAIPHEAFDAEERRSHNWSVVARLAEGVSLERARSEMRQIASVLAAEHPQFMKGWGVNVVPLHADLVAEVRPLLLVLLGGVILVLLIACANIASVLLARAISREREMAVRGALGAGRARLVRQVLTESLVLAALGGLVGVGIAAIGLDAMLSFAPRDLPLTEQVALDPTVLGFAVAVTFGSTLVFGLLPALRLARADLQATLRASDLRAGGPPQARLRNGLLVAEAALSVVLLSGAGLMIRSSGQLGRVDYGYRADQLVAADFNLPRARYADSRAHQAFYANLLERIAVLPGVAAVAGTSSPPTSTSTTFSFAIEGRPAMNPSGREDPQALRVVTPDYFRTLGVPLLQGRVFDARDRSDAPEVIVINEALARRHWPQGDAVGKRISFAGAEGPWKEIVGVVGDTRLLAADEPAGPALYMPHEQKQWTWMSWLTLMIRLEPRGSLTTLMPELRAAVRALDAELPIERVATVNDLYGETLATRRFATTLLVGFAAAALLLGVIGIYGVLAYNVAERRREFGIQLALGATRGRVISGVLRQALRLAVAGVLLGAAASLALTRILTSLLYEVSPSDPLTLATVALLLLAVAVVAGLVPALRATRVTPLSIMRES